jgi:hypothetical protein
MLPYGVAGDLLDEYLRMSETTRKAMYRFRRAVIVVFSDLYLREPTVVGTAQPLQIKDARWFRE